MIEEPREEEQYELDVLMVQLQSDWKKLRDTHQKFVHVFKDELQAIAHASDNILPDVIPDEIMHDSLYISLLSGRCTWDNEAVPLTNTELKMVAALGRRPDQVYSRDYFMDAFFEDGESDRLVDSHIKRIRRKFEAVEPRFDRIYTLYGAGYRWNP